MILEHYSGAPLVWPPQDIEQVSHEQDGMWKPRGLWVSVKGPYDWPWFCNAEDFRPDSMKHCTIIHLSEDANIKLVSGQQELLAFDDEYGVDWTPVSDLSMRRIDWVRVAREYDGVIIAPYVWECRMGDYETVNGVLRKTKEGRVSDWYYPWDVASGCIWNGTKAIKAFEPVSVKEAA